jgi:hypothetical protein
MHAAAGAHHARVGACIGGTRLKPLLGFKEPIETLVEIPIELRSCAAL